MTRWLSQWGLRESPFTKEISDADLWVPGSRVASLFAVAGEQLYAVVRGRCLLQAGHSGLVIVDVDLRTQRWRVVSPASPGIRASRMSRCVSRPGAASCSSTSKTTAKACPRPTGAAASVSSPCASALRLSASQQVSWLRARRKERDGGEILGLAGLERPQE